MEMIAFLTLLVGIIGLAYKLVRDTTAEAIKAKDAQIELLKTEIENLQIQISPKMRDALVQMKQHLEDTIRTLEAGVSERDQRISELRGRRQRNESQIEELTRIKHGLNDRIRHLDEIIESEVVNHLDEFVYTFVSVKLPDGSDEEVKSFIEEAMAIGEMPYHAYQLRAGRMERRIRLRYTKRVSQRTLHRILTDLSLKYSELVVVQGYDFKSEL